MLAFEEIEKFLNQQLTAEEKEKIKNLEETKIVRNFDLTGKIFERLLVIGRGPGKVSPNGTKICQWWCICNCPKHSILLVKTGNLNSKNTKSCGCLDIEKSTERIVKIAQKNALDITNKQFGELTAIRPTSERKGNSVVWECKCSCGKIHFAAVNELNAGRIQSCGHPQESLGVRKIKEILTENSINFVTEKTFPTCKFPDTKASARFDFYLPEKNILIEFDGIQHFEARDLTFFSDSLEKRQQHDQFKNNWCKENQIKLVRIPYYLIDQLSLNLILGELND